MSTAAVPDSLYLSPNQQDLLLAALTSNSPSPAPMFGAVPPPHSQQQQQHPHQHQTPLLGTQKPPSTSTSYPPPPQGSPPMMPLSLDGDFPHNTPLLADDMDYGEWDGEFDADGPWDYSLGSGDVMHDTPASVSNDGDTTNGDTPHPTFKTESEKRKEPPPGEGSEGPQESDPKRRDDKDNANKTAKKPGRKPLTSEPTSKRKAQNRAAQRAFRERKEKHLKDLEMKVADLEEASESTNHENSLLRAQVDRLQTELREYKRRLHTSELTRSSSFATIGGFQFDFPPFGSGIFGQKDGITKDAALKFGSASSLMDRMNSLEKQSPSNNNASTTTTSTTTTTATAATAANGRNTSGSAYPAGFDSQSMQGTPKLNGRDTTSSPSASSVSQHGPGSSSCGTSPEPTNHSPVSSKPVDSLQPVSEGAANTTTPVADTYVCRSGSLDGETETTFCEKLGMACGNPNNPVPKAPQFSTASTAAASSLDWLAQQSSSNTFDPVLFNDYRDTVNDITTNLSMSFFDDAFPAVSFDPIGSPAPPPPPKKDLIAEIDALNNGEDDENEVVPGDGHKQMLSCNKIWDRISSHPRFVSGELDMDGLCSELRSKAKCSEVGVVVAENDVQEVLGKVGMSHEDVM